MLDRSQVTDALFFGQTCLVISSPCNTYLNAEHGQLHSHYLYSRKEKLEELQ